MDWLKANRAYFIAAALFIVAGAKALNWITTEQAATLVALIGGLGVTVVHAAIRENKKAIEATQAAISSMRFSQSHELPTSHDSVGGGK